MSSECARSFPHSFPRAAGERFFPLARRRLFFIARGRRKSHARHCARIAGTRFPSFFARDEEAARAQLSSMASSTPLARGGDGVVMVPARDVFEGRRDAAADLLHERFRLARGRICPSPRAPCRTLCARRTRPPRVRPASTISCSSSCTSSSLCRTLNTRVRPLAARADVPRLVERISSPSARSSATSLHDDLAGDAEHLRQAGRRDGLGAEAARDRPAAVLPAHSLLPFRQDHTSRPTGCRFFKDTSRMGAEWVSAPQETISAPISFSRAAFSA